MNRKRCFILVISTIVLLGLLGLAPMSLYGEKVADGIYFYSISASGYIAKSTGKLVFLSK